MRPDICIFAKAPVPGRVKTRLAAEIGALAALEIYTLMLARTVHRLSSDRWRTRLWVTPDDAARSGALWPGVVPRIPQGGGDLGARMGRALRSARPDAPVVVVGSDIPALAARHVVRAEAALRTAPLVFGPSRDGGFYLVAAREPPPETLFHGVTWSAATTLAQILQGGGADAALIDMLEDLDDFDTLCRNRADPDWRDLHAIGVTGARKP